MPSLTPTDNVVMAAAAAVSETLTKGGIPFYTGADSSSRQVRLQPAASTTPSWAPTPPTWRLTSSRPALSPHTTSWTAAVITVNTETAAALGIDYSAFNDLAGQVVEVTTAE